MGRIIRAPEEWIPLPDEEGMFLGGGISNCWNWQEPVGKILVRETKLAIIDPRREKWEVSTQNPDSVPQIKWEYRDLRRCKYNLFWFPHETLCPITLFELGSALERLPADQLFVGCHPEYQRRLDVVTQVALQRPDIEVQDNVEAMAYYILSKLPRELRI